MKVGEVVQIRVNPRDCMGVADVVSKVGARIDGMSFSQAVSIALTTLLETARVAQAIPVRDGFEFAQIMAPFEFKGRSKRKLEITQAFQLTNPTPVMDMNPVPKENIAAKRALIRVNELEAKRDADPGNWSPGEQRLLDQAMNDLLAAASAGS